MKRWLTVAVAAVLGVLVALLVVPRFTQQHQYVGTLFTDVEPAPAFTLTTDTGERSGLEAFEDKVVLIYFGYTFCPDVCPASLAELATAMEELGDDAAQVQVAMISVDPGRDTPEVLNEYLDHFHTDFVGFTGSDAEIAAVASAFDVYYETQAASAETGYLVDHWAGVLLIDRDGNLAEVFGYGTPGEQIASDVTEWL